MFRRSRQPVTDPSPSLQIDPIGLVEPVYLDVDMLQTYVAALQNGVTYVVRETRRSDIERTREVKAGFTVPVLSASVGAGGSILGRDTSRQTKDFERSHTLVLPFRQPPCEPCLPEECGEGGQVW